jgi:hypothetical protein
MLSLSPREKDFGLIMRQALRHYRLYSIDPGGRIHRPPIEANFHTDAEATAYARSLLETERIEVWCGTRRVASLEPTPRWPSH